MAKNSAHDHGSGRKLLLTAAAVVVVPMVALPAVLLAVVFYYRVTQSTAVFADLSGSQESFSNNAYYVDLSATKIATIASWSSSLVLTLTGVVMYMWSYAASNGLLLASGDTDSTDRARRGAVPPTPYQFSLLVQLLDGGFMALWDLTTYLVRWKRRRPTFARVVRASAGVLVVFILLSLGIIAGDQWFHLSTSSVIVTQVYPTTATSGNGTTLHAYGKRVADSCSAAADNNGLPCTLLSTPLLDALVNSSVAYATTNNVSETARAELVVRDGVTYAMLVDPSAAADIDYAASTLGVAASCRQLGAQCDWQQPMGNTATFDCAPIRFRGTSLAQTGMRSHLLQTYENAEGTTNATDRSQINPFWLAFSVNIDSVDEYAGQPLYMADDASVVIPDHGLSVVVWCAVTAYDVAYARVNGTVAAFAATPANASVGGMVHGPTQAAFEVAKWKEALRVAAFANDSQVLADAFGVAVAQTAVGLVAGQVSAAANAHEQRRAQIVVACVRRAPLFVLVALDVLFALLAVAVAAVAVRLAARPGVRELHARLGIAGLVAEAFERARAQQPAWDAPALFSEWHGDPDTALAARRTDYGGLKLEAVSTAVSTAPVAKTVTPTAASVSAAAMSSAGPPSPRRDGSTENGPRHEQ